MGRRNNIEVTQEELNRALVEEAQRHPGHEREVFDFYQKSPEAMANLRAPVFEDKVIDYIIELATVSERKVAPEDLRREIEAEHDARAAEGGEQTRKQAAGGKSPSSDQAGKAKRGGKAAAAKKG